MSYAVAERISMHCIRNVPWMSANVVTRILNICKNRDIYTIADLLRRWPTQRDFRSASPFGPLARQELIRWVVSLGIGWPTGVKVKRKTKLEAIDHMARTSGLTLLPLPTHSDISIPWNGGHIHILGLPNEPTEDECHRILDSLDKWLHDRVRS